MFRWRTSALAFATLAALLTPAAATAATPAVSVSLTSSSGPWITTTGKVTGGVTRQPVALQLRVGTTWADIARSTLTSSGSYTITAQPQLGSAGYRVLLLPTSKIRSAASKTVGFSGLLRATPTSPIAGETTTISGRMPTRVARPVTLQRISSNKWVASGAQTVNSDKLGRFSLKVPASNSTFRAYAPARKIGTRGYAAYGSPTLTVRPVAQSVDVTAPARVTAGSRVAITARVVPARTGRTAVLQRESDSGWQTDSYASQDADGIARFSAEPITSTSSFRVLIFAANGAAGVVSDSVTVDVPPVFTAAPERVTNLTGSGADGGITGNGNYQPRLGRTVSADGRYFLLSTGAWSLSSVGGTYLYDRTTGATTVVGPGPEGGFDGHASDATMSANGRWIAFMASSNLLREDVNPSPAIFVWDRTTNTTIQIPGQRVSKPSISADGSSVVYQAKLEEYHDRGDGDSVDAVFQWRRSTGKSVLVSGSGGRPDFNFNSAEGPQTSSDGSFVAYELDNRLAVWNRNDGTTRFVTRPNGADQDTDFRGDLSMSEDGRFLLYTRLVSVDLDDGYTSSTTASLWDRVTGTNTEIGPPEDGLRPRHQGSQAAFLSPDGRFAFYYAEDSPLFETPEEQNPPQQLIRFDRVTGQRVLVTDDDNGAKANLRTNLAGVTDDGRHAIVYSAATNLGQDDTNQRDDLFAIDIDWSTPAGRAGFPKARAGERAPARTRAAAIPDDGRTTLISHTPSGVPSGLHLGRSTNSSMSADGRYVAFQSNSRDLHPAVAGQSTWDQIYVWDRSTGEIDWITEGLDGKGGNDTSQAPTVSADGRYVAFGSGASNLVAGDDPSHGESDAFVWDRVTGETQLVSVTGGSGPTIARNVTMSADGNTVAFVSQGPIYLWSRSTGAVAQLPSRLLSDESLFIPDGLSLSADGRYLSYGQIGSDEPLKVWDNEARTARVVAAGGCPMISGDGKTVVYCAGAVGDIFVWSAISGTSTKITRGVDGQASTASSSNPHVSSDGSTVSFTSSAENLVPDDANHYADIFVWHRSTDTIVRQSLRGSGSEANGNSWENSISGDGKIVNYSTEATNLNYPAPGEFPFTASNLFQSKVR